MTKDNITIMKTLMSIFDQAIKTIQREKEVELTIHNIAYEAQGIIEETSANEEERKLLWKELELVQTTLFNRLTIEEEQSLC